MYQKKKSKKSSNQAASVAKVSVVADKFIHRKQGKSKLRRTEEHDL